MATTAEGQHDGIQPSAGPTNKFDGVSAHSEVDGQTDQTLTVGDLRQPWQAGNVAAPATGGGVLGSIVT